MPSSAASNSSIVNQPTTSPCVPPSPCSVLPLEAICSTIERNIRELLSRNYEVAALVRAQSLPLGAGASSGSEGEQQVGLVLELAAPGGSAGHAGLALALQVAAEDGGQGVEFEFGEMTGASLDTAGGGAKAAGAVPGGGGSVVSLSAASGAAAARRVQFSGAAVIDMPFGAGGSAAGGATDAGGGEPRGLNRMASLIEVELASGATPAGLSPREAGPAPGYSWLHD